MVPEESIGSGMMTKRAKKKKKSDDGGTQEDKQVASAGGLCAYYKRHRIPTAGNIYLLFNWNTRGHRVFKVQPSLPSMLNSCLKIETHRWWL